MRIWVGLLLLFVLFLLSCSHKNYQSIKHAEFSRPEIFDSSFIKGVYQSSYTFYDRNISGITVIKKTDSSFRLVSISEIGLKYFDLEFFTNRKKDPVVHYVMDVLNRKLLLKRLIFDFNLLFNYPDNKLKFNDVIVKSGKYVYIGKPSAETISTAGWFGSKPLVQINYNETEYPSEIEINRSNIKIIFKEL